MTIEQQDDQLQREIDSWLISLEGHFAALKADCDEMFRCEYARLLLALQQALPLAMSDDVSAEWYREWWHLAGAMQALLQRLHEGAE